MKKPRNFSIRVRMNFYILSNQQEILQCSLLQQRLKLLRRIDWKLVRLYLHLPRR